MGEFLQTKPLPIFWTDEEIIKVVAQIVTIQMSYEDAEKLQPPKEMEKIHNTFLEGMKYYNDAMDNLIKGIDSLDVDLINKAANKMNKGNKSIEEVTKLIEKFTKEKL
jgi:soluble cytochrome b562